MLPEQGLLQELWAPGCTVTLPPQYGTSSPTALQLSLSPTLKLQPRSQNSPGDKARPLQHAQLQLEEMRENSWGRGPGHPCIETEDHRPLETSGAADTQPCSRLLGLFGQGKGLSEPRAAFSPCF